MESQSGIPQDLENVDFDREVLTFSPLPETPLQLQPEQSATVRNSPEQSGTVPKMLFIYPRLLGRIQVPGVAPTTNTTTTHKTHNTPVTPRTSGSADFNVSDIVSVGERVALVEAKRSLVSDP